MLPTHKKDLEDKIANLVSAYMRDNKGAVINDIDLRFTDYDTVGGEPIRVIMEVIVNLKERS